MRVWIMNNWNLILAAVLWGATMEWMYPFEFLNTSTWKGGIALVSIVVGVFVLANFIVGLVLGLFRREVKS